MQGRLKALGQNNVLKQGKKNSINSTTNTAVLPDMRVAEFMNAEQWLQTADCKVILGFSTAK